MRRAKLGDVYCFKVPNGYKLVQWAYYIPKRGHYLRVFEGLYDAIPDDIAPIVKGPHNYIIAFHISRAYTLGLAEWMGNYPVPEEFPFPKFRITFWQDSQGEVHNIWLTPNDKTATGNMNILSFSGSRMKDLPMAYQGETLLASSVSPDWLLYLFDYNFTLNNPKWLWPQTALGNGWEKKLAEYQNVVDQALAQEKHKREVK